MPIIYYSHDIYWIHVLDNKMKTTKKQQKTEKGSLT